MAVDDAYTQWSETYDSDRNLTRDLDEKVTREVLGDFRCRSILEIGCGTGKNTAFLAGVGESVRALDFSEGMLRKAREKITQGNVTFAVADLTRPWPVGDGTADLIVGNLVLEHIADLTFVFAQAARVLVDGGRFFVCELHPFRQYQGGKAVFQQGRETTEIDAYVHHVSDFTRSAAINGFTIGRLDEWWHPEDENKPPRLLSFLFRKA